MEFKKYPRIYRLGTEETDGILDGVCHVQEKIDGANASIWMQDGVIHCGSRNNDLTENGNTFNGFVEYVKNHEGINKFFENFPDSRMYGEWLVKHTVPYQETAYQHFYLFDVEGPDGEAGVDTVHSIAKTYELKAPHLFGVFTNPTHEEINEMVGKSEIGASGEGVVIKNIAFINKFDERRHAKLVTQDFTERNAIVFGGNNKHSQTYWEMYVVNKYMTLPRVRKIIQKIESERSCVVIEDTPRVANSAYHDMLTEEIWEIANKAGSVDFKKLKGFATKKAIQIFHDILEDSVSIADDTE